MPASYVRPKQQQKGKQQRGKRHERERDNRHWQAIQVAYRAWRDSDSPDEKAVRTSINAEFAKADLLVLVKR
jgi:hypothetical protein